MQKKTVKVWCAYLILIELVAMPGCANMSEGEKKTWGTIGGALVGAAAGAAIGGKKNRTGGAIIGAVAGAAAGYMLASHFGSKATPEQKARPEFREAAQHFDAGKNAQEAGNHDVAIQEYQVAATKAPEQPEPYVNMGYAYLDKNDRAAAEQSFRKALAVDPTNEEAKAGLEGMGLTA